MAKFFTGRNALIALLICVAGLSFALGYFVGKASNSGGTLQTAKAKADDEEIDRLIEKYAPGSPEKASSTPESVPKYEPPIIKESPPEAPLKETKPAPKVIAPPKTETTKAPAPKTASKPASTAKKTTGALYTVQVGAYNKEAEAEALRKKFASKGYSVYVSKGSSAPAYRVRIGKYSSKEKAEEAAAKVGKNENLKAFVTFY